MRRVNPQLSCKRDQIKLEITWKCKLLQLSGLPKLPSFKQAQKYSGTRVMRTPREHAVVSVLSGSPHQAGSHKNVTDRVKRNCG